MNTNFSGVFRIAGRSSSKLLSDIERFNERRIVTLAFDGSLPSASIVITVVAVIFPASRDRFGGDGLPS